jgi:hypothetical protein
MVSESAEPEFWYFRAEEAKVKAEMLRGAETRAIMLRLAEIYKELGDSAVARLVQNPSKEVS